MIPLIIDGKPCTADAGAALITAAAANGIYIPSLCSHPDLPPFKDLPRAARVFRGETSYVNEPPSEDQPPPSDNHQSSIVNRQSLTANPQLEGCGLCVVEVDGVAEPVRACQTEVTAGLSVRTASPALVELRRTNLMRILARHPHACLTCAQREGCSLETCSSNVPKEERCCPKFHNCELRRVAEYVGIKPETPRYRPAGLPVLRGDPLFTRDYNLCIDCARCVRVCNQVRGVEALGLVQCEGRLVVGSVAPTLLASACKFCGACVEVCPTGCLLDKEPQAGPREHWLVPCVHACPAGVDVPDYIRRVAAGDFNEAAALVWEKLPLPNVLGHICFHLCEVDCRRGRIDDPVAICALKRFALEAADGPWGARRLPSADTGKKVAIVGAGPAGLTAAYFLRMKGHAVTLFEAASAPGGMPARSVPNYRLSQSVLDKDIAVIRALGVEIKTGCRAEPAEAAAILRAQGFQVVLVAVGLPYSKRITVPGTDLAGVFWGLEFLSAVKAGQTFELGRQVVVIGGGNVAIDVARTAVRLAHRLEADAAPVVRLFCLETRDQMPAHASEVAAAAAEGVEINPAWGPATILGAAGRVAGVELRRCLTVFDEQRRFAPTFDEQQRQMVAADSVILAVGQSPPAGVPAEGGGVFLAGDVTGDLQSVVHAVASGRAAAARIDQYLGGDGQFAVQLANHRPPDPWLGREVGFAPRPRVAVPQAAPHQRRVGFLEVENTYPPDQAVCEARRCLQCDLRLMIRPAVSPPEKWLEFTAANVGAVPGVEGVFVLADADKKPLVIKGTSDVHAGLLAQLAAQPQARYFAWEADRMYTKRESELIQQHVERYGQLPGGGDELDELF